MKLVCSNDFANVRKLGIRLPGHDEALRLPKDQQPDALAKIYPNGNALHIPKGARFEIAPGIDNVKDLNGEDAEKILSLVNTSNKAVLDVPNCAKDIAKIDAEVAAAVKVKAKREAAAAAPASLDKVSDALAAMIQAAVASALKANAKAAA